MVKIGVNMRCKCGSDNVHKRGNRDGRQRTRCVDCGKWDSSYLSPSGAKILLFDIETTPMEVFVWGLFGNKYIQHGNVIKDWNVLSWSAKWLFDSQVISDIQTPKEAKSRDDKRVLGGIWDLINQANVVIAHNGDKFDLKKLNTRFHMNGYLPPSPYQSIDTLKVAKRNFAFSSNRLDYLGQIMTNKGKISTNFKLWTDCLDGNKEALQKMLAYNEEDVRLLEEVYVELRPWVKSHPNVGVYMSGEVCPTCGSDDIHTNGGYYTTNANRYESYRCGGCGSLSRKLKSVLSLEDRRELMRPLPR
jgi:transposase-like protein